MGETYLSDNAGNRVPPTPQSASPIAGSGQLLTDAIIGADHTATVVAGATYVATYIAAITDSTAMSMNFGIADVTTDANVLWVCTPYESCVIHIPEGYTTLHYEGAVNGASVRLRRIS